MKKIYVPEDESELVLLTGLLEAAGIPFYVNNDHVGNMTRFLTFGSQIYAKAIHVAECDEERAVKLIQEHISGRSSE